MRFISGKTARTSLCDRSTRVPQNTRRKGGDLLDVCGKRYSSREPEVAHVRIHSACCERWREKKKEKNPTLLEVLSVP